MNPNGRGKLVEYFSTLSDLINLTHILWNYSGNNKLYRETKKTLNQRIIPKLKKLTNEQIGNLEDLTEDDYSLYAFITEYKSLIKSGKTKEAENFSRDWLRHVRDGKNSPKLTTYWEGAEGNYEVW